MTRPTCPHLEACGGCDLGAVESGQQLEQKAGFVQRAFGLDARPAIIPSPRPVAYRARIKLAVADGRVGYRAHRRHDLVPIQTCGIARAEVQDALTRLREWMTPQRGERVRSIEIRSDGTRAVFNVELTGKSVKAPVRTGLFELGDVALNGRRLCGEPTLRLDVLGQALRASPRAFYQVNLEANLLLAQHVRDVVSASDPHRVLDLYAGNGNLTFQAAALGVPVLAVEREGQSTSDLAEMIGERDVRVLTLPVERFDPSREFFDVVVLDPPRKGAPGIVERLLLNRPTTIVYVSCHAPAAARDIRAATAAGYTVSDVTCFDLFPDTHHVETVVVLRR